MRSGSASSLPTSQPLIDGSAFSSSDGPLLRTPTAQLAINGGSQHPDKRRSGGHGPTLADEVEFLLSNTGVPLLPTPAANDTGNPPEDHLRKKPGRKQVTSLMCLVDHGLISRGGRPEADPVPGPWGPYAPAIARWELATGRAVPPATQPTGRNGAQRLSPVFVEWMMGTEPGHVTDLASKCQPHGPRPRPGCAQCRSGLSRSAQLRLLGNGAVPQQSSAALRTLLGRAFGVTATMEEEAS